MSTKPAFIECETCGYYHPVEFFGDCRDDANRFDGSQLDERYGADGWHQQEFEIHYRHCGTEWTQYWSCACNDECPTCGAEIEPYEFEEVYS
jgi:hypothetical protein